MMSFKPLMEEAQHTSNGTMEHIGKDWVFIVTKNKYNKIKNKLIKSFKRTSSRIFYFINKIYESKKARTLAHGIGMSQVVDQVTVS